MPGGRERGGGWGAVRVLRARNTGCYLAGVVVSGFGSSAMALAAGVWTKSLTGSDSLAGLTTFCVWAPVLVGPLIGARADGVRRRLLLIRVNLAMALALLPVLAVRSPGQVWILFAVLLVHGTGAVLADAAEAGLVTAAVPEESRGDFNGLRLTANEGMKLVAPLLGAALFARFGGHGVALLNTVTFLLAAGAFALVRVAEPLPRARRSAGTPPDSSAAGPQAALPEVDEAEAAPPEAAPPGGSGVARNLGKARGHRTKRTRGRRSRARRRPGAAEGPRFLRADRALRRLTGAGAVTMLAAGLNGAAVYAVVDAGLARAPEFAGTLYAVQGAGSVLSGTAAGALLRRMPERVFAAAGIAVFALGTALRTLPSVPVALVASALIGAGLPCVLIASLTAVQRTAPHALVGRVAATANSVLFVPNALALAAGSGLLAVVGHRVVLLSAAALAVAAAAWCALPPASPGARRRPRRRRTTSESAVPHGRSS